MFISYKNVEYLGKKDGKNTWRYELIDSEFGTVFGAVIDSAETNSWVVFGVVAVIQEYSKRNMNVAANLVMAFKWYDKQYHFLSIQKIIDFNKKCNPLFPQYEEDLQKYLVLL
jgi:hypothetical protein